MRKNLLIIFTIFLVTILANACNHTPTEIDETTCSVSGTCGDGFVCKSQYSGTEVCDPNAALGGHCRSDCTSCDSYSYLSATTCLPYTCQGTQPANSDICLGDDVDLTYNQNYAIKSGSCSSTYKCEVICNSGYTKSADGLSCVIPTVAAVCGNNIVEGSEECDGPFPNSQSCTYNGYSGNQYCRTPSSTNSCKWDTLSEGSPGVAVGYKINGCSLSDYCGDGIKQSNEQCDDDNNINGDGCQANCVPGCTENWNCGDDYGPVYTKDGIKYRDYRTPVDTSCGATISSDYYKIVCPKREVIIIGNTGDSCYAYSNVKNLNCGNNAIADAKAEGPCTCDGNGGNCPYNDRNTYVEQCDVAYGVEKDKNGNVVDCDDWTCTLN